MGSYPIQKTQKVVTISGTKSRAKLRNPKTKSTNFTPPSSQIYTTHELCNLNMRQKNQESSNMNTISRQKPVLINTNITKNRAPKQKP